jgi:signal peptidase II
MPALLSHPYVRLGWLVAAITFVVDQVHKWWMILGYGIEAKERVRVLPFLDLVYVINKGVSFGSLAGETMRWQVALAIFAVVVSIGLTIWLARGVDSKLLAVSVGLLIGGALGNALDRLLLGGVADFFLLHAFGWSWYVFNIADVAIVAGVVGLLYDSFRNRGVTA